MFTDATDFSISMWVNVAQQSDDHPFISNKDWGSSNNKGWGIFSQSGGNLRDQVTGTGGTKFSVNPAVNWKDNAWHNIVVTFKRNVESVAYFDGVPVLTSPLLTTGSIDTDDLALAVNIGQDGTGHYTDGGTSSIDALIDDVGVWRRVITPGEAGTNLFERFVRPEHRLNRRRSTQVRDIHSLGRPASHHGNRSERDRETADAREPRPRDAMAGCRPFQRDRGHQHHGRNRVLSRG